MTGADVASLLGSWDPDWLAVAEQKDRDKDVQSTSTNEELAEGGAVATCLGTAGSNYEISVRLDCLSNCLSVNIYLFLPCHVVMIIDVNIYSVCGVNKQI